MESGTALCPECGTPMAPDGTCPNCGYEADTVPIASAPQITEEERAAIASAPNEKLCEYLQAGNLFCARIAIDEGASVEHTPSYKGNEGVPHVVSAADFNDGKVLAFLLQHGADPYKIYKMADYSGKSTYLPSKQKQAFADKCLHGDPQYGTKWYEVSAALLAALHPDGRAAKLIADEAKQAPQGSGCYIATAVYGSYAHPQVKRLRRYRDEVLLQSVGGKIFVKIYYKISPPLAKHLAKATVINKMVKSLLETWLKRLH